MTDKAAIIAELIELTTIPQIDLQHDLTAQELAPHLRCDPTNVMRKLGPLVKAGLYGTDIKQHPDTRRQHRVWWRIEDGPENGIDADGNL